MRDITGSLLGLGSWKLSVVDDIVETYFESGGESDIVKMNEDQLRGFRQMVSDALYEKEGMENIKVYAVEKAARMPLDNSKTRSDDMYVSF